MASKTNLEIWGGIEPTINRVGNRFLDQLQWADFYNQPQQLDAIISLGIKTLRFPILWEKHQPQLDGEIDFTWAASCLQKLKEHNINPIIGLLHHGSGPAFTDLLQPGFPELFSAYASRVAQAFPWVTDYTPVNEPLTTARFSGLYGIWYPHKTNDVSFIKILLNELKATVLAMEAIRRVNPAARLIQTEDLGKTYSTPLLSYQANFENNRRWLTYDILNGNFNESHPLWNYFMRLGIDKDTLHFFLDNPCVPDIIGVNYYVTSERYLDENTGAYPLANIGGNSLHQYADIESIRVDHTAPHGPSVLLREISERYRLPLAITEVHLHCTREEQLRWINEIYRTAVGLKKEGINILSITPWALLGSFGWNKLLTCTSCEYESGAFDISAGYTRPTAVASFIRSLVNNEPFYDHILLQPGWWKRRSRFLSKGRQDILQESLTRPVLITGRNGTLGKAFSRICMNRNIPHILLARDEMDICNSAQIEKVIGQFKPWAIINTAGFVRVDEAEERKDFCYRENYLGPQKLAILCEQYKIRLLTFSTDLVFDGNKNDAYVESDSPNPLNTYGHSKMLAESFLRNVNPSSLIIRTSAFFGPWDEFNFIHKIIHDLIENKTIHVADDVTVSPTYVPHLVDACLDLLIDNESGTWHLTNQGQVTWYEFATRAATLAGLDTGLIIPGYDMETRAAYPKQSALKSEKYNRMPSLDEALHQYMQEQKDFAFLVK